MSARDIQRGRPGKKKAAKSRYDRAPKVGETEQRVRPAKDAHAPLRPNERHGDLRLLVEFENALENGLRLLSAVPDTLERLRDAQAGQPPSQSYEGHSGLNTPLWCHVHQSDRCTERNTAGDDVQCRHLVSHTMRPDPAGEAAIGSDRARMDERDLTAALRRVVVAVEAGMTVAAAWSAGHAPTPGQRARVAEENRRWCHAHIAADNPNTGAPYKVEPLTQTASNVGGRLAVPVLLCRWCADFVVRTEDTPDGPRIPNAEEVVIHESGGKVYIHDGRKAS